AEDVRAIFGGRDGAKREEGDAYAEYQRGLMDKADALYKERQGAMKWKPPVYTSMLLSNNGFIGEQGNERYKDIKFGPKGNVNQNGCGAIAVQNMNLMLGKKSNFIDVVNQFNQDSDESTILGGIVGGNPKYLKSIYEDQGYQVKEVRRAEELPKDGSKFMLLSFYKDPIGAHYEAAEWTDTGKLRVYNTSSAQNGLAYMEFDDLQAYQKKVGSQDKDRYSRTNYIAIK
ncbi:MAG: hypothetical protein RSA86_07850, partial [Christensenellaceae bacterium]